MYLSFALHDCIADAVLFEERHGLIFCWMRKLQVVHDINVRNIIVWRECVLRIRNEKSA